MNMRLRHRPHAYANGHDRKTSLFLRIEPTTERSSSADTFASRPAAFGRAAIKQIRMSVAAAVMPRTHVRARTISRARTIGTIPSSRCQTTSRAAIVSITHATRTFSMDEISVRAIGIERCAPAGGARRDRTDDLLLAKQALSQLSYGPGASLRTR
jgi:hypothetical protein